MSTVYQHQLHAHKTRRKHPWRWTIGVLLIIGSVTTFGLSTLKSQTVVSVPKTVIKKVDTATAVDSYQKGVFTIDLPKGWQFMSKQSDVYTIYHFRGTGQEDGNRLLDIYEDSQLPNFAINRMMPVVANETGGLTTDASMVSDNCDEYTTGSLAGRSTVGVIAKWQGIEFLCDKGNTLRNVVGSGSKDGLNNVFIKTPTSRQHRYFMAYTDNNIKPDYAIFAAAINSFKVIE